MMVHPTPFMLTTVQAIARQPLMTDFPACLLGLNSTAQPKISTATQWNEELPNQGLM